MDWYVISSTQGHDFGFAAPDSRIANRCAVLLEYISSHKSCVNTPTVFPSDSRQKWDEIIGMREHIMRSCLPDSRICSLRRRKHTKEDKLIGDGGKETVSIGIYLCRT
jgi:hypothetical protein